MDRTHKIYKIQFPNGKVYIGQTVDVNSRWREHLRATLYNSMYYISFLINLYICFLFIEKTVIEIIINFHDDFKEFCMVNIHT